MAELVLENLGRPEQGQYFPSSITHFATPDFACTDDSAPNVAEYSPVIAVAYTSFDDKAGLLWARLMAEGKMAGRPRSGLDMIIAAVAGANDCVVVTDNEKDFVGLQIINPLRRGLEGGGIEQ